MNEPIFYVVGFSDVPQMNPGKLAAQVAHAQSQLFFSILERNPDYTETSFYDWSNQGHNFGTTIVLSDSSENFLENIMRRYKTSQIIHFGMVTDPTYPMVNHYGFSFTKEIDTCGWFFYDPEYEENKRIKDEYISTLPLHP